MVVQDGVDERRPDKRVAIVVAVPAGAAAGGQPVLQSLGAAGEAPSAAVGHVAKFSGIDVDQRAGVGMLVAADRLPGNPVNG